MTVVISPRAERDFEARVNWLRIHSPAAGRRAATCIVELIDMLSDFPELGQLVQGGLREKHVQFGRDGFVVRYRVLATGITVLRIYHSRQDR